MTYVLINGELAQMTPCQQQQGGGGSSGSSSSVSSPSIAPELKPLANLYVKQATGIANTPYQAYTGQGTAGLTGTQNAGIGMIQNRALGGSQTMDNAETALNGVINNQNSNPYLDSMVNKASQGVVNNFNNATVGSGAYGNSGLGEQLGKGLADVSSTMYGNAYNTDQSNKLSAISQAPTFGNAAYQDASQLMNAGGLQQSNQQNALDFAYNQFQNAQNYPFKQLAATGNVVGQNMGQSTQTTQSGGGK